MFRGYAVISLILFSGDSNNKFFGLNFSVKLFENGLSYEFRLLFAPISVLAARLPGSLVTVLTVLLLGWITYASVNNALTDQLGLDVTVPDEIQDVTL